MPASDPDLGGNQKVDYYLEDEWNSLQVDDEGNVRVWRQLDREGMIGGVGRVKIIGVDHGDPPLSSTATLTVTLTDVNDSPPRLLPPTTFQVEEGSPPTRLGVLTATDDDVWSLGHGPPFNFTLAPSNPLYVYDYIQLRLDPHLDAGRGGAELWTTAPIDREEHRVLIVEVTVSDAGKLAETYPISVVVRDINDNPMKPGSKTVYLWKTQSGGAEVSMGRVFVEDPDDWDIGDKTFHWLGPPHQLFALDTNTGIIYANSHIREGSYDLQFSVSDRVWNQSNVRANVTVVVRVLPPDALTHAVPLMLTPTTPKHLTQKWNPMSGGGGLGALVRGIKEALKEKAESVHVVSVYEDDQWKGLISNISSKTKLLRDGLASEDMVVARVWISVRQESGSFMDPVKLEGLLAMHTQELEEATELTVVAGNGVDNVLQERKGKDKDRVAGGRTSTERQSSATSLASTAPALQVVDTNSTSIVTPRLFRRQVCPPNVVVLEPEACTPTTCLNGGRCVRSDLSYRCICPFGTWGSRCKVVSRTFTGIGWAWVHPVPLCLPTTVSFQLLTRRPEALLLYLGPLAPTGRKIIQGPAPMLSLELRQGRPQFLLEGPGGPIQMTVNTTRPLHDGSWHVLHLHFDNKGVSLMVDYCAGRDGEMVKESNCVAKTRWKRPITSKAWVGSEPLQVGGMAHPVPRPEQHDWTHGPSAKPLTGCIRRLSINGVLVDLGSPAHSHGSYQGCALQDEACPSGCGFHGLCDGGLHSPVCNCDPGWSGTDCSLQTVPASLGNGSYVKMALSFTPGPYKASMQIRLRTRQRQGDILQLSSEHQASSFTLTLENGLACVVVQGGEHRTKQRLCLTSRPVNDGVWHYLRAERYGANLLISMDDGDSWRQNATIYTLVTVKEKLSLRSRKKSPELLKLLNVDKQEGVHIGGTPEFLGVSVLKVHRDLENSCIDDVRIDDRPLPIPPAENGTQWGQVTMWENVQRDCQAADACGNLTCGPPFTCTDIWKQAVCSCGPGKELVGGKCQDVDECIYRPCLYSGTCINRRPMYSCSCTPGHAGNNCQWPIDVNSLMYVTTPAVFTAIMLFLLILLLAGGLLFYRNRRQRAGGTGDRNRDRQGGSDGDDAGSSRTGKEVDRDTGKEIQTIEMEHDKIWLAVNPELPNGRTAIISQTGPSSKKKAAEFASKKAREEGGGGGEAPRGGPPGGVGAMTEKGGVVVPVMARDDLRAYAYEGDGSSSGSLSSALSGLRVDLTDDGEISKLAPSFREVVDLLRHLPDTFDSTKSTNSTSTTSNNSKSTPNSTLRRPKQEISTVC
ncbi:neural-cadherin-like isoform X2 [Oratosquilla oratoria]|uniref:neural-cadherin-like isoform X2 n=1 Tax=Oratosquilla oratoria TaxID=337810 RepID=UPI003F757ADE